ncbi:hypothetical protein CTM67_00070 [Photobacterium phosphoreum]|nr:hypothetical protein CTM67_00070 [Photobacterium phosphoreum]
MTNQPINQSTNQPINQSTNQPILIPLIKWSSFKSIRFPIALAGIHCRECRKRTLNEVRNLL